MKWIALTFGLASLTVSAPALVIDTFSNTQGPYTSRFGSGSTGREAASVLGGSRFVSSLQLGNNSAQNTLRVDNGLWGSPEFGAVPHAWIAYFTTDVISPSVVQYSPNTNFDFGDNNAFQIRMGGNEKPLWISARLASNDGESSRMRFLKQIEPGGERIVTLLPSDVVELDPGFDPSKIDYLDFSFQSEASGDFKVNSIIAFNQPVPEPATMTAMAVGIVGLMRRRSRR